jgi:hypothetical protein
VKDQLKHLLDFGKPAALFAVVFLLPLLPLLFGSPPVPGWEFGVPAGLLTLAGVTLISHRMLCYGCKNPVRWDALVGVACLAAAAFILTMPYRR